MAERETDKKPLPPYIPYRTFKGLLIKLRDTTVPNQIDLSVLRSYSNSMARMIIASLKYMKLIDATGATSDRLRELVNSVSEPKVWEEVFLKFFFDVYDPILGQLDVSNATPRQLEERFRDAGADGQMLQKCLAFFTAAAEDAKIELSPHITNRPRKARGTAKAKPRTRKTQDEDDSQGMSAESAHTFAVKNVARFQFPIPDKGAATILIPANTSADDWEMINTMMSAYVSRLEKNKE